MRGHLVAQQHWHVVSSFKRSCSHTRHHIPRDCHRAAAKKPLGYKLVGYKLALDAQMQIHSCLDHSCSQSGKRQEWCNGRRVHRLQAVVMLRHVRFLPALLARALSCTASVSNVLVAGANVCADKTASALSTYFVHGQWNTSYPLMSSINMPPYGYHSSDGCLPEKASWWRVDLGAEFNLVSIVFWPRQDGQVQSSNLKITFENKVKMASSVLNVAHPPLILSDSIFIRTDKRFQISLVKHQSSLILPLLFSPTPLPLPLRKIFRH